MTPENQKKHDERLKRINDAVALKEPDKVPINPNPQLYSIFHSGYTVAEIVYDTSMEKMRNALIKYHSDFEPDAASDVSSMYVSEGPIVEKIVSKNLQVAGMPGNPIGENSLQQFIEFPLLLDEEFEEFSRDRTGWALKKAMPRMAGLFEPLARLQVGFGEAPRIARLFARSVSLPEVRSMIEDLWAIDALYSDIQVKADKISMEILDMGFPVLRWGKSAGLVPFDVYSDFLRGTLLTMEDFFEHPDEIESYINEAIEVSVDMILSTKGTDEGKQVFIPLHKGMDGFMSDELYRKYYWSHLQKMILALIESGKIPYIYTEGKYNTRIDCLTEVPAGKVIYHFEDVDMAVAKKKLGGIACISGGFPAALLDWGKPEQVRDETKRLLDICAPGGGFIFETSCGMGNCKRENVEIMFETVREYGSSS